MGAGIALFNRYSGLTAAAAVSPRSPVAAGRLSGTCLMSMQSEPKPAYIPPITCTCGGTAMLARTVLQPTKLGVAELRMFQCFACRDVAEVLVDPYGATSR